MAGIQSHRDLIVWQKAMKLAADCYRLSKMMPKEEEYRLISQLLRAAASIPANIAEGHARGSRKDYARFISIARGSLAETETFLQLVADVGVLPAQSIKEPLELSIEISKMLTVLLSRLRKAP